MEEWRAVFGFEGSYEVSSYGRVRSLDRIIVRSDGRVLRWKGRILIPRQANAKRYPVVSLGADLQIGVHKLVMITFVGPCPPGMEVLHGDGDKSNNSLVNLSYGTHLENMADAVAAGVMVANGTWFRGERCKRRHLLLAPNLHERFDCRRCLACLKANQMRRAKRWRDFEMQALADQVYVDLGFELEAAA